MIVVIQNTDNLNIEVNTCSMLVLFLGRKMEGTFDLIWVPRGLHTFCRMHKVYKHICVCIAHIINYHKCPILGTYHDKCYTRALHTFSAEEIDVMVVFHILWTNQLYFDMSLKMQWTNLHTPTLLHKNTNLKH